MKTRILSIAAIIVIALGVSNLTYAGTVNRESAVVLTDIHQINKIEVHGNVELYVSDGNEDQVKVYNKYYAESALVQSQDGILRISSYNPEKLVVWVTVSDLRSLILYDNAEVKSFGKLSSIDLDVQLFNTASAKLNLDTYDTNVSLNDHTTADIEGSVTDFTVQHNRSSIVNNSNLSADHYVKTLTGDKAEKENAQEFVGL